MNNLPAVRQAKWHFDHKHAYTAAQQVAASQELAKWALFSNSQITTFTGLATHKVGALTGKTDRTGGKLEGEALAPIIELFALKSRGEISAVAVREALDAGVTAGMLQRLVGIPATTVRRYAKVTA